MPANLTPEYHNAEKRFKEASSLEEKILGLEEMIATLPKHKGTDRLFGDLKKRLSKLKEEGLRQKKSGKKELWQIKTEGAAQIVLVGPPNSGKSTILKSFTGAQPVISEYPFTTQISVPGMLKFQDVQFQLVELPAIAEGIMQPWVPNAIMMADAMAIVLDPSTDAVLDHLECCLHQLWKRNVFPFAEAEALGPQDNPRVRRCFIIANKRSSPQTGENLSLLKDWLSHISIDDEDISQKMMKESARNIEFFELDGLSAEHQNTLGARLFSFMGIIRVYPKRPGKKIERADPLIMKKGSTVLEAATLLHKEIGRNLKYARAWGNGIYEGQQLARDFELKDGYVIEFHF